MKSPQLPSYIEAYSNGILEERIKSARSALNPCTSCPRNCMVNRTLENSGICNTGEKAQISSYGAHFGEESPLVGRFGSGTIFFTNCNLLCNFCQNYDISHQGKGREVIDEELGDFMIELQERGCHNINLVTPSHVIPQILSALKIAIQKGLTIPIVYNTGGYDALKSLKLLDGIIDIYMPDLKFLDHYSARICSLPENYPEVVKEAIMEMHRQVGDLTMDVQGIAVRGVLIRHLVLPENLANSEKVMTFIANEISQNTYINIMSQYRPCFKATSLPQLSRQINDSEFKEALEAARRSGLHRIDI